MINSKKIKILLLLISIFLSKHTNAFFWSSHDSMYEKGDFVYVFREKWRPAKILKIVFHSGENYYHVTFVGLSKEYDVWTKEARMHAMQ
jgi:hypothetical protein